MEKVIEHLRRMARAEGAEQPVIGDAGSEPCIVCIETGRVWKIVLDEIVSDIKCGSAELDEPADYTQ